MATTTIKGQNPFPKGNPQNVKVETPNGTVTSRGGVLRDSSIDSPVQSDREPPRGWK